MTTDHLKCLTCDTPCFLLALTGCSRSDCPHLSEPRVSDGPLSTEAAPIGPH